MKQSLSFCVFFFQAEDGIRDRNVTGVQTCALPILMGANIGTTVTTILLAVGMANVGIYFMVLAFVGKIGRASCRERV